MGFNFPATPAVGEVYTPVNGPSYQWDGEKWTGGGQARQPTEQFFDLSGLTQQDITVPTWAKGCKITGIVLAPAGSQWVLMRVSTDGTNFFAGASDYTSGGPLHSTGTGAYATNVMGNTNAFQLCGSTDNSATHPMSFDVDLMVSRNPSAYFNMRGYSKIYDTAAAALSRTHWIWAYLFAATAGITQLKAMRVLLNSGGAFAAGSWLRVQWLGDTGQLQVGTSVPDAPNDGKAYVRRNNVWQPVLATLKKAIVNSNTTYTRAATSEAQMSDTMAFVPVSATSQIFLRCWFYCRLLGNTTLAVDDQAGSIVLKYSDGSVWQNKHILTFGDANRVQVAANLIYWFNLSYPTIDVTASRSLTNGQVSVRLYGNPNYPNLTLETYLAICEFEEFE